MRKWGAFILEVINAQISYGKNTVLTGVGFEIHDGAGIAVLGRNGSGKSTLLRAISGVHKPDCGEILLKGRSVFESDTRRDIGFVPQNDITFGDLSVSDNLAFWGAAYGLNKRSVFGNSVTETLGLAPVMKKRVRALSGGMRKRLCIAASLLHDPSVIILDEPFSEIDVVAKQEFIEYLLSLKNAGKTIIITSHNAFELTALCDEFYVIADKRVEAVSRDGFDKNPEQSIAKIIRRGL